MEKRRDKKPSLRTTTVLNYQQVKQVHRGLTKLESKQYAGKKPECYLLTDALIDSFCDKEKPLTQRQKEKIRQDYSKKLNIQVLDLN